MNKSNWIKINNNNNNKNNSSNSYFHLPAIFANSKQLKWFKRTNIYVKIALMILKNKAIFINNLNSLNVWLAKNNLDKFSTVLSVKVVFGNRNHKIN